MNRRQRLAQRRELLQLEVQLQRERIRLAAGTLRGGLAPGAPAGRIRTWRKVLQIAWLAALAWRRLRPSPSPSSN